jgi:hypothetical protein
MPTGALGERVPARHRFSVGIVSLFLQMVVKAATSFRGAAAVLKLCGPHWPYAGGIPCWNSGRWWLLRVGLFELCREKPRADDWVWMMDHTIQLGPWKCLVVIGVRLSSWLEDRRPLRHEDVALLNLTPMEHSSGEQVHEQLQAVVETTGVPLAVLSDGGTDLKRGMELLHQDHPKVQHVLDLKHTHALLLKRELEKDDRWGSFVTKANQTKLGVTQTALAFLNPPGLKTKARYMNLDSLVSWGVRALAYLDHPRDFPEQKIDRKKLRAKLGWLRRYRRALRGWSELLSLVKTVETHVHREGLYPGISEALKQPLPPLVSTAAGRRFQDAQLRFLAEQSRPLAPGRRMLGSTEVLESIIGKYKRLQSTHAKGGMTAMLLGIGAIVGKKSEVVLAQALQTIRTQDVVTWCRNALGPTIASQRRLALGATKPG